MNVFVSVGEPSGDLHGANLVRALSARCPDAHVHGFGGPRMAAAGVKLLYPLTELAVMGVRRVVRHIPTFFQLADLAEHSFRTNRPDAVVLIDYPGFNFHLAKRAHSWGIPVYYFVPPQLWAWRRGRVRKVRKWFSGVLTALPFEDEWYRSYGVPTHYVGHPYFDELAAQQLNPAFLATQRARPGRVVALLPGSRTQEVAANIALMLAAATRIAARCPQSRFLVAAFSERHATTIRPIAEASGLPIEVHVGATPEIIEAAEVAIAVSGSVSLELMYRTTPTVIVYHMGPLALWLARRLVHLPYITLVNLLAQEELFPEVVTSQDDSERIATEILHWLNDPVAAHDRVTRLRALCDRVAVPGACERAAEFLLNASYSQNRPAA